MSKKRKCQYNDLWKEEFPFINPLNDNTHVKCTICGATFSIGSGGKTSVKEHLETQKHKSGLEARSRSDNLNNYFRKVEPSKAEFNLAVHEGLCSLCIRSPNPAVSPAVNIQERVRHHEGDKNVTATFVNHDGGGRVWTWLTNRKAPSGPPQLSSHSTTPAENHYTLDETYTTVGEALYAELDRDSGNSPAYQNTAYNGSDTDPDAPPSSAPSSAYYSDLSCATAPDRTYEAVGVSVNTNVGASWENSDAAVRRHPIPRLAAITETITVPSDYV